MSAGIHGRRAVRPSVRLVSEAGVTLIELLVTVAIMGIAFTAILGGVLTSVIGSDIHRKQATAETVLRSYAEAVKAKTGWDACGAATESTYAPAAVGFTVPGDFSAAATEVEYWVPSGNTGTWSTTPCSTDTGLQRISLQVSSADGQATESVQIVRRLP